MIDVTFSISVPEVLVERLKASFGRFMHAYLFEPVGDRDVIELRATSSFFRDEAKVRFRCQVLMGLE
jgi:hypothetical protein